MSKRLNNFNQFHVNNWQITKSSGLWKKQGKYWSDHSSGRVASIGFKQLYSMTSKEMLGEMLGIGISMDLCHQRSCTSWYPGMQWAYIPVFYQPDHRSHDLSSLRVYSSWAASVHYLGLKKRHDSQPSLRKITLNNCFIQRMMDYIPTVIPSLRQELNELWDRILHLLE